MAYRDEQFFWDTKKAVEDLSKGYGLIVTSGVDRREEYPGPIYYVYSLFEILDKQGKSSKYEFTIYNCYFSLNPYSPKSLADKIIYSVIRDVPLDGYQLKISIV